MHPELQKFNLIISGRDWCNLFDRNFQEQIDQMQEKAIERRIIIVYMDYKNNMIFSFLANSIICHLSMHLSEKYYPLIK